MKSIDVKSPYEAEYVERILSRRLGTLIFQNLTIANLADL